MKRIVLLVGVAVFGLVGTARGADDKRPEPKYEGKSLDYWVERLQKCEKAEERQAACEALKAFGADAAPAVPDLMVMLNDLSSSYRGQVAEVVVDVGQAGAKPVVPALVRLLKDDRTRDKDLVISTLGRLGPKAAEAVPAVTLTLSDGELRITAIRTLRDIGPAAKGAVPALVEFLKDKDARGDVLNALQATGPDASSAVPAIHEALVRAQDTKPDKGTARVDNEGEAADRKEAEEWQVACVRTLAAIGPDAKVTVPSLVKLLKSDSLDLRLSAAKALWSIDKHPDAVPTLIDLLKLPAWQDIRLWGDERVVALGEIGAPAKAALPQLKKAYAEMWDDHLREEIAKAIKKIDREEAKKLKKPTPAVPLGASWVPASGGR
jgi:HEAT repeat protein